MKTTNKNNAKAEAIDAAVAELTPYRSLREFCDAYVVGYRPTFRADLDPRFAAIADAFDAEMARRGRKERAFRSSLAPAPPRGPDRRKPAGVHSAPEGGAAARMLASPMPSGPDRLRRFALPDCYLGYRGGLGDFC